MNGEDYLQQRFPDMTPISSVPTLSTVNGIGLTLYGSRDYDEETRSYVGTHFFCLLFIPIIAVGAYRVIDAHPGWYFLGKVPMSKLARGWNLCLVLALVFGSGGFWWNSHANNPETVAASNLSQGDRLAGQGKIGEAAAKYQQVARGQTGSTGTALQKLSDLFQGSLDEAEGAELLRAFTVGVESFRAKNRPDNLYEAGLNQAKKRTASDATTAWKLLEIVAPLAPPNDQQVARMKKPLLEKILVQNPDNLDALSDLAVLHESEKQLDQCEKLLTPKRELLGNREGARVLGQILANKGEFEQAMPLLQGYVDERLKRLKAAEENLKNTVKRIDDSMIAQLKSGTAPGFNFKLAEQLKANRNAQDAMVQAYLNTHLTNHPDFKAGQDALKAEARVVPVAFDLGMALLRRAQTVEDPVSRRKQLEKAEETFVAVQGVAGKSDEFRLTLGQVYYWLGKQDQARKLFDEVLQATNNSSMSLVLVAQVLREVGETTEARQRAEEAYNKAPPGRDKDVAAGFRAHVSLDQDDRILWLTRVQTQDRHTQGELCAALGSKAAAENRDAEAEQQMRAALEHYAALPESAASLNNSALVYFSLYRVTSADKDLSQGIANLEKAVSLDHRNSILVGNAADMVMANSIRAILGNGLDWKTLKSNGSMDLVSYFYRDPAAKDEWRAQFKKHPGIAKARAYYERLLVLAPKKAQTYSVLTSLYVFTQDHEALRQLRDRVITAELDHADAMRIFKELYEDKNLAQYLKDLQNAVQVDEKRLPDARKVGGATLAVALGRLSHDRIGLLNHDRPLGEGRDPVALAEEAHKVAPSFATENLLTEALLVRAHHQLIKQDARYAEMAKRARRSLTPQHLIAIGMEQGGATQKACLAHADVQRVIAMLKTQSETYDEEFREWNWAMLRHSEPEWAAIKAKQYLKSEIAQLTGAIAQRVLPLNAGDAYRQAWSLQMQGRDADAAAVLRRCVEQGIPMPVSKE